MFAKLSYYLLLVLVLALSVSACGASVPQDRPKDNGDIYLATEDGAGPNAMAKEMEAEAAGNSNEFDAAMVLCNSSFSIPMDYIVQFNNTAEMPDMDKTAMCFIRCFYEKTGLINNWQLNANKIKQSMWPATGDSIEYCQEQGKTEPNACVRTYAIAKCLMMRAIVDARNKPMV